MERTKTSRWDVTKFLADEASMAAYLQAMIEESGGDPQMIAVALGDIARARGMTAIAREANITREALYRALSPDGNPAFGTVMKVLAAMHLKLAILPSAATVVLPAAPRPAVARRPRAKRAVAAGC